MNPDKQSFLVQYLQDGETDIKDNDSNATPEQQVASNQQLQIAYRNRNTFIIAENLTTPTFDCITFAWQNSVMMRALKDYDYISMMEVAARLSGAALAITMRDPPDDWLGAITTTPQACRIQSKTNSGTPLPAFITKLLSSGIPTTHHLPHQDCYSIPVNWTGL